MNRPRLSESGIEYLDYSWGIWSGCRNLEVGLCSVNACWAKGLTLHYPKIYPEGFEPHYYPEAINSPVKLKKPSIISVGWVGDVIGYGLKYKEDIFDTIYNCPQHTFLFLTKNPERLLDWSPFPANCRVGVTATDTEKLLQACVSLEEVRAKGKYLSVEPFLNWNYGWTESYLVNALERAKINQVIIGAQTKPYKPPKFEWVAEIVKACDMAGIPVFLKNNLKPLVVDNLGHTYHGFAYGENLRQEMPNNDAGRTTGKSPASLAGEEGSTPSPARPN